MFFSEPVSGYGVFFFFLSKEASFGGKIKSDCGSVMFFPSPFYLKGFFFPLPLERLLKKNLCMCVLPDFVSVHPMHAVLTEARRGR